MKALLLSLAVIAFPIMASAQNSSDANLKEVRVLGEAKNNLGERIVVRELRVEGKSDEARQHSGQHYYRFESYSLGTLYDCITTWDMSEPGKVTLTWRTDKNCEISLLNGWLTVTYDQEKRSQPWNFARRID